MSRYGRKVKIFSALEVANICGVVNQTAINWIKSGHLKAFTTPGGQYRVYAKDLAAFLDTRGMADSGTALNVFLEKSNRSLLMLAVVNQAVGSRIKEELTAKLPEYDIILAFDGFDMGRMITESKPAFIVLDKSLPGIDVGRFVQTMKEDATYGKPFVFMMNQPASETLPPDTDGAFNLPEELNRLVEKIKILEKQPAENAFSA